MKDVRSAPALATDREFHRSGLLALIFAPQTMIVGALAIGALERFSRLGAYELSGDEASSWAAAAQPTLSRLVAVQFQVNPGKLPVHEMVLRAWMAAFGQSVYALRSLSAACGMISIALIYLISVELLGGSKTRRARRIGATTMLLAAASPVLIRIDYNARMYALMLLFTLAQMLFFLRAGRRRGLVNYAALAAFTTLAFATNFTSALVIAVEGVWLVGEAAWDWRAGARSHDLIDWRRLAALAIGLAVLAPFVGAFQSSIRGEQRGMFAWIAMPGRWEPLATFESANGSWVFPLLAALAAYGVVHEYRSHARAVAFAMLWMWLPPTVLLAGSYAVMPMLVTRYMVSCFVPFFIATAWGLEAVRRQALRGALIVLVTLLMVVWVHSYFRHPRDGQWREAAAFALARAGAGGTIGVVPVDNEVYLLSYYLPADQRWRVVALTHARSGANADGPQLAAVSELSRGAVRKKFAAQYPVVLATFRGVTVRARGAPLTTPPRGSPVSRASR